MYIYSTFHSRKLLLAGLVFLFSMPLFAAGSEETAEKGGRAAVVDGILADGEYLFVKDVSGIRFGCTYSPEGTLYLAVSAPTAGWIAIGVGSDKMDGAEIFLAADRNGVPAFRHDRGMGRQHTPEAGNPVMIWKVQEKSGTTTLELELPADGIVKDNKLPVILAYGKDDVFSSYHGSRAGLTLIFK